MTAAASFPNDTAAVFVVVDAAEARRADLECGSIALVTNSTSLNAMKFYGQGLTVLFVGTMGLVGNVLAFATILSMSRPLSLFYKLLAVLAVSDVVFILSSGLFTVKQAIEFDLPGYNIVFPYVIYPVAAISMTCSTYSCLAIAAERYLGICHPYNADSWYRKFRFFIFGILAACLLIDLPRFFEVRPQYDEATGEAVGFRYTGLRTDSTYIIAYAMWYRLITTIALPFALIVFFNFKVLQYYKQTSLQMTNSAERSLFAIFVCISAMFLVCHFPRGILNILEFQYQRNQARCFEQYGRSFVPPHWIYITMYVEKILLMLNASANFLYYCFSGSEFRTRLLRILRCSRPGGSTTVRRESASVRYTDHLTTTILAGETTTQQQTANVLEAMVCANGGGRDFTISRGSVVSLNGAPASTTGSNTTHYGACNRRLMFLGNIYSRTDQLDKVTEC